MTENNCLKSNAEVMIGPLNKKDDSLFCLKRGRMVSNSPTID